MPSEFGPEYDAIHANISRLPHADFAVVTQLLDGYNSPSGEDFNAVEKATDDVMWDRLSTPEEMPSVDTDAMLDRLGDELPEDFDDQVQDALEGPLLDALVAAAAKTVAEGRGTELPADTYDRLMARYLAVAAQLAAA